MRIAIIGATGFIGQALIRKLLHDTNYNLVGFSKSAGRLDFGSAANGRLTLVSGDLFNDAQLKQALESCEVAIYLVHMMGASRDYAAREADGARLFGEAAQKAHVKRVIFLGGLGDDSEALSKHLASRQRTGHILRQHLPLVIELRASMVIGDGSVAYDIIKAIAQKLPLLIIPRWSVTKTQPIALADALAYLQAAITLPTTTHVTIGIGGPEVLTYREALRRYTIWAGHKQHVFAVPGVPRWAAGWWLSHFMPQKDAAIGIAMVESLHHEMIVTDTQASELFPAIKPRPIEQAFS